MCAGHSLWTARFYISALDVSACIIASCACVNILPCQIHAVERAELSMSWGAIDCK